MMELKLNYASKKGAPCEMANIVKRIRNVWLALLHDYRTHVIDHKYLMNNLWIENTCTKIHILVSKHTITGDNINMTKITISLFPHEMRWNYSGLENA